MKASILGLVRRSGEYEGHTYDNMNLHCAYRDPNVTGTRVEVIKVKFPIWSEALSEAGLLVDTDAIGATARFEFDRFGRIVNVEIEPKQTAQ